MDRLTRSITLAIQSYRLLLEDKELMVLPLISGALMAVVTTSFFFGMGLNRGVVPQDQSEWLFPVFAFYVVTYTIGIYFQAAVVAGATERMRGGNPTVGSALRAATRRLPSILLWGLTAATVGMVLRSIQERSQLVGRLVVGVVGAAWSLATFFIVPAIVVDELSVSEGLSHSVSVFRKTWGETLAGSVGVGLAAMVAWLGLIGVVGLLAWAQLVVPAIVAGATGAVLLFMFFSALEGVYLASLYRYASEGDVPPGFDATEIRHAFPRGRRSPEF
jgi:hypothetical protein